MNWIVLTGADVRRVISSGTQARANENTADTVLEGDAYDPAQANRRDLAVAQAVAEVRGAIRAAGRFPLSTTANSVPPEAVHHTLVLAAWRLITAGVGHESQGTQWALLTATESPFRKEYEESCRYVSNPQHATNGLPPGLAEGRSVTLPNLAEQTGQDWETAISTSNPAVRSIRWADSLATDEEYEDEVTAEGVIVNNLTNWMNTN